MTYDRNRQFVTVLLVFGAIVFGMVLAGGLNLTVPGLSAPETSPAAREPLPPTSTSRQVFPSFADLAEHVSPAVASIQASSFDRGRSGRGRGRGQDPFEFFFGPRRDAPEDSDQEFRSDSGGSGFVVSEDGYVVTNNHVIQGAEQVQVRLGDEIYEAEVKGTDPATDLALLKIEVDEPLVYLPLGDSDALRVGDWVMAIGSPQGLTNSVTVGVVSAKGRRINISQETYSFEDFIQTDAAINFGNSGGPLINLSGEVIGINTAINWGSENIGFAVPVHILQNVLTQLRDTGRVRRGYLGIGVNDLTSRAAEAFGLDSTDGAMVSSVQSGLPGDKAGLEHGDIILEVDGRSVENTRDLIDYVSGKGPDATVDLKILRDGDILKKKVELAERPSDGGDQSEAGEPEESGIDWMGLRYQDLTPGLKSMHDLPEDLQGVWITEISPRSPLYDEGVRSGRVLNVITEVNGTKVQDVDTFESMVRAAESGARLRVYIRRFVGGTEAQPLFVFPAVP